MAAKKTKTTKQTQSKELNRIIELLERIENAIERLIQQDRGDFKTKQIHVSETGRFGAIEQVEAEQIGGRIEEKVKPDVFINQKGDVVELTYKSVKVEAQKLVSINEFTDQAGFEKARVIITSYGVAKLEDVPKENYSEIVAQFRKAIKEWK